MTGCNSASPTGPSADPLAGTWQGTWTSTAPAYGGTARLVAQLTQAGSQLTAVIVMAEHLCVTGSSATGDVANRQISFVLVGSSGDRTEFTGVLSGDSKSMSGSYQMIGGPCPPLAGSADSGTWTLTR